MAQDQVLRSGNFDVGIRPRKNINLNSDSLNQGGIIRPYESILCCLMEGLSDDVQLKGLGSLDLPEGFSIQGLEDGSVRTRPS